MSRQLVIPLRQQYNLFKQIVLQEKVNFQKSVKAGFTFVGLLLFLLHFSDGLNKIYTDLRVNNSVLHRALTLNPNEHPRLFHLCSRMITKSKITLQNLAESFHRRVRANIANFSTQDIIN